MNYIVRCWFILRASYLKWNTINYFGLQGKSLQDKNSKLNDLRFLKEGKNTPIIKWVPSANTKSDSMTGTRGAAIVYCCERSDYFVPAPDSIIDWTTGHTLPFIEEGECVFAELFNRLDHNHSKFEEGSATFFDKIDEYLTGSSYHSILKPFRKNKDKFGLWNCIVVNYTRVANWEQEGKENLN